MIKTNQRNKRPLVWNSFILLYYPLTHLDLMVSMNNSYGHKIDSQHEFDQQSFWAIC